MSLGVDSMTKSNEQFAAEQDARSLVEAEVIRKDTKRFGRATAELKKQNEAATEAMKK